MQNSMGILFEDDVDVVDVSVETEAVVAEAVSRVEENIEIEAEMQASMRYGDLLEEGLNTITFFKNSISKYGFDEMFVETMEFCGIGKVLSRSGNSIPSMENLQNPHRARLEAERIVAALEDDERNFLQKIWDWIWTQLKRFGNWIKSIFTGSKDEIKKTEEVAEKVAEAIEEGEVEKDTPIGEGVGESAATTEAESPGFLDMCSEKLGHLMGRFKGAKAGGFKEAISEAASDLHEKEKLIKEAEKELDDLEAKIKEAESKKIEIPLSVALPGGSLVKSTTKAHMTVKDIGELHKQAEEETKKLQVEAKKKEEEAKKLQAEAKSNPEKAKEAAKVSKEATAIAKEAKERVGWMAKIAKVGASLKKKTISVVKKVDTTVLTMNRKENSDKKIADHHKANPNESKLKKKSNLEKRAEKAQGRLTESGRKAKRIKDGMPDLNRQLKYDI